MSNQLSMFTRFLALVVTVLVMSVTEAQPVVTFGSDSVTVAGLTPGARVVSYGVLREAVGYRQRVTHGVSGVLDEDRNGAVEVMSGRHVPWHTLFVVVDSTNGASVVAGPRAELFATSRQRLTPGQVRKIVRAGSFAAFLLVRPGLGAWSLTIEDSGTNDDDTTPDGQLGLELHRMVPVGGAPSPPRTFERSDVLFAIDPETLSVVEWRAE